MHTSQVTFPLFLAVLGLNALGCGQAADSSLPSSPGCDGGAGPISDVPVAPAVRPVPHLDHVLPPLAPAPVTEGDSGTAGAAPADENGDATADVTAPHVVSIKPENGAVGVSSSTPIVIEFSEAMAAPSVLLAFGSAELPLSLLEATWNGAGTVLTLTPKGALEYAGQAVTDGEMLAPSAKSYRFTLSASATDLAGNPLPETSASFATLREITHTITATKALTGAVAAANSEQIFGFVSFDSRSLPRGIRALERATLLVPPHATHEDVPVVDVEFDELSPAAILAGPATPVGTLPGATFGDLPLPANVLAYLVRDYLNQGDTPGYSQFRLQLPAAASAFDLQAIDDVLDQTSLELVYLLP